MSTTDKTTPLTSTLPDSGTESSTVVGSSTQSEVSTGWTSEYTTSVVAKCEITGWTQWMNVDQPNNGMSGGDYEIYALLRAKYVFCERKQITEINCHENELDIPANETNQLMSCTIMYGFKCKNSDQPSGECLDYKVRFYCDCALSTIVTEPQTTTTTATGTSTSISTSTSELTLSTTTVINGSPACEWTPWFNVHSPNEVGEAELISEIGALNVICPTEYITSIQCRRSTNGTPFDQAGQKNVVCSIIYGGLICTNADQINGESCFDYEVRFYCEPPKCMSGDNSTTTAVVSSTETSHSSYSTGTMSTGPIYSSTSAGHNVTTTITFTESSTMSSTSTQSQTSHIRKYS